MNKFAKNYPVMKCLGMYCLSLFLHLMPKIAVAGDIAGTPLLAYPGGAHNVLIIQGNATTMASSIGGTSKASIVSNAVSQLITDTKAVSAKAAISGQSIGLGLMTYGGTSSVSPYLFPLSASPYTVYGVNALGPNATPPAPNELTGSTLNSNNSSCYNNATLFYRNVDPISHPYCLPTSIPRNYLQSNGTCSSSIPATGSLTRCYKNTNNQVRSAIPALGKLRIAIDVIPKAINPDGTTNSIATAKAQTYTTALSAAGNTGGKAIEGALLTACDYFNTKWFGVGHELKSRCHRGYPPGPQSNPPLNQFTDTQQSYTSPSSVPEIPVSCDSSIVLITDGLQDTTADGIPSSAAIGYRYTPDFTLTEKNIGVVPNDPLSYRGGLTDPVFVALYDLYGGNKSSRIRTFVVGLGVTASSNFDLLGGYGFNSAAAKSYYPASLVTMKDSLNNIFSNIMFTPTGSPQSSFSSVASNSTDLQATTLLFQPQYKYNAGWFGDLIAYSLSNDGLSLGSQKWSAADHLNVNTDAGAGFSAASRSIYTYNPTTGLGIPFSCSSLNTNQANTLNCTQGQSTQSNLVNWLRGDNSLANNVSFRNRSGKNLGDIVNSSPVYVGAEDYAYDSLPEGTATSEHPYQAFIDSKADRNPVVYVGANDGMLHGIAVGTSPDFSDGGAEVFAFVPNAVIGQGLKDYAAPPTGGTYYPHVFSVDGSPAVGDAYLNNMWKTILVGTTGVGGKSVFALDVTCPNTSASCNSGFSADSVMWEISDADASACTPVCGNTSTGSTTSIHNDLGYTASKASIVRLNNGQWGAIVANGYNSYNGHAVLFIFNLADGSVIRKFDTGVGSVTAKNGLSKPLAVDVDGNRTADYVYAGDLQGNLWKFNLTCPNEGTCAPATDWTVSPQPVFVACTDNTCTDSNRQPIYNKPSVGAANSQGQQDGLMLYVGTGKFFELGDNIVPGSPQTQTFYGFWDDGSGTTVTRANLVTQTIASQDQSFRTSSSNPVDYTQMKGWYLDLLTPGSGSLGERVVNDSVVTNGSVLFVTLIPNSSANPAASCTAGGSSWLMDLSASNGWPVQGAAWANGFASASGLKSTVGAATAPAIIRKSDGSQIRVYSGSQKNNQNNTNIPPPIQGGGGAGSMQKRISWSQVQ